jgi:hypothetical protein
MATIHEMDDASDPLLPGEIPLDEPLPALPDRAGGSGITIAREIDEEEPVVDPKEVEGLGLAGTGRNMCEFLPGPPEDDVDEG